MEEDNDHPDPMSSQVLLYLSPVPFCQEKNSMTHPGQPLGGDPHRYPVYYHPSHPESGGLLPIISSRHPPY
ncbi:hypothetical protein BO94DRAFT_536707 [Aspergillus sclerotioniger CBS 115572]|uniref:Uncharacterized protein n=1 Tax=Aspergillus sclerotioniger CBS 115572 TaxID=1450535 RepID=A0A317WBC2_9EURO|nr:hypothetical protein BO94DRAFT_536707 [Aspergillus sclerotioniger CBS 115572]PWY83235.1 hypothetical protein BO94DRAFT_536707 [Aspergillus sclerotioniger CBS 115572]